MMCGEVCGRPRCWPYNEVEETLVTVDRDPVTWSRDR